LHEQRTVPFERERDRGSVVSPVDRDASRRALGVPHHQVRIAEIFDDFCVKTIPSDELERAGTHGCDQNDAFSGASAPADQGRVGGLLQIFEPLLETVELPGDAELRIDRIRIDACLTSLEDELRRRRDVLTVS
jgi:hypothetical protein